MQSLIENFVFARIIKLSLFHIRQLYYIQLVMQPAALNLLQFRFHFAEVRASFKVFFIFFKSIVCVYLLIANVSILD